jgi:GT2 family glycosyltransferase
MSETGLSARLPLSLIVCTYRRPAAVKRLLEALRLQTAPPQEVLIVDASSEAGTEETVQEAAATVPRFRLAYFRVPPEHRGLTRQRNFGVARAAGELIAFLDDDTVPESNYFQEIQGCFERHPEAAGVGGYIRGVTWRPADRTAEPGVGVFRWANWERREDYRWRLRKMLGLASPAPPGWMPPCGHGRSVDFLPPDGRDYQVEFFIGAASSWRRVVFEREVFSSYFEGYGLYEDLDFCIQVSRQKPLYVCTSAQVDHHHDPAARPNSFRYGIMVVRNGWYVWRRRWPEASLFDRARWWAVTALVAICRLVDARGSDLAEGPQEAFGRLWSMVELLWKDPRIARKAWDERSCS